MTKSLLAIHPLAILTPADWRQRPLLGVFRTSGAVSTGLLVSVILGLFSEL